MPFFVDGRTTLTRSKEITMPKHFCIIAALVYLVIFPATAQVTWDSSNVGSAANLSDIVISSRSNVFAIGDTGTIARSTDAGRTWICQPSGTTRGFVSIVFVDSLHGVAGGSNALRFTTDGGSSWQTPSTLPSHGTKSVAFANTNLGVAVGTGGQVLRTTNGGVDWSMTVSTASQSLYGVAFIDSVTVIAVGNSCIRKSTDGGLTWPLGFSPAAVLLDVATPAPDCVVAVGYTAPGQKVTAYRTADKGVTWDSVIVDSRDQFKAVKFTSRDTGFTVSANGKLYQTRNGGSTWDSIATLPSGATPTSIAVTSTGTLLFSGARGNVFRLTGGLSAVTDEVQVPHSTSLQQNYPNPFNPSTTISYRLSSHTHVLLSVFNLLGQEVRVLENAAQDPGEYHVNFNADGLATGMYLYRLKTDASIETKKLILVR
jgi:photosystem II stability/assembly factor-like uncharacterized protein